MSPPSSRHRAPPGPTQRQLRAGELVRHALVEILRVESFADPALQGHPVTLTQVRVSPDLKHALCYVEPLGGAAADEVIGALNRAARFLRGRLGHEIQMKFTPDLKFVRDESFDAAEHISRLLSDPRVRRDVDRPDEATGEEPS
jgi:ribosome-binding factor A